MGVLAEPLNEFSPGSEIGVHFVMFLSCGMGAS